MRIEEASLLAAPEKVSRGAGEVSQAVHAQSPHRAAADPTQVVSSGSKTENRDTVEQRSSMHAVSVLFGVAKSNRIVFKLLDENTGRVIRQVPPEEMLKFSEGLDEILQEPQHATKKNTEGA